MSDKESSWAEVILPSAKDKVKGPFVKNFIF